MKRIAFFIYEKLMIFLFYAFRLFPVKKKKVFVICFGGKKYGDNCQFVAEELHRLCPDADIVWAREKGYDFEVPSYIRTVKRQSLKKIYEYCTAGTWLSTHYLESYVRKRKGQYYIQLWHAGLGIKKIGFDAVSESNKDRRERIRVSADLADLMISNSDYRSDIYRNTFGYHGEILKCGTPKTDVFFGDKSRYRALIREHYGLSGDVRILLYAPTYRTAKQKKPLSEIFDLDYVRLKAVLEKRFGGEWRVFVRWHPKTLHTEFAERKIEGAENVTEYPDMQSLIFAADAFVSDYSSGIFEARFSGLPCFIYASDVVEYGKKSGLNYSMEELPFPFASSNDELEKLILSYDEAKEKERWPEFTKKVGLVETGHASRDVAQRILSEMG